MQSIGKPYLKDDVIDKTGFLKKARLHQSTFRAVHLDQPCNEYGNYLTISGGVDGFNFYPRFGIFEAVKNYRKYNKALYCNMLRSEHIPFNFFIPLNLNKDFCKEIFNEFFDQTILSIDRIEIEYAPKPKYNYLNDATAFDTCIEYTHVDNTKGIIGIEVKYTEQAYKLIAKSKEEKDLEDFGSRYYVVTEKSGIYKPEAIPQLRTDKFRQIWRNHMLGESILIADGEKFKHFTSLTLFPEGNTHFVKTSKEYMELLKRNDKKFMPVTYEDFFTAIEKYCPDEDYGKWLNYLRERYIVKT